MFSGKLGNILMGAVAGMAGDFIPPVLGDYTKPAVFAGASYFFKKPTLMVLAGYELGRAINPFGNTGGGLFKGQGD
jgi:hypothetical protein